jgi:hypothetical protein
MRRLYFSAIPFPGHSGRKTFASPVVYTNVGILHRKTFAGENQFLDLMTSSLHGKDTHYEVEYWDMGPELQSEVNGAGVGFTLPATGSESIGHFMSQNLTLNSLRTGWYPKTRDNLKPDLSARLLRLSFGISI